MGEDEASVCWGYRDREEGQSKGNQGGRRDRAGGPMGSS